MICAEVLASRTSDSKSELPTPLACPTAGMISESGGGVFLPPVETGVTRLTETGMLTAVTTFAAPVDVAPVKEMLIVPVLVPRLSGPGSEVMVSVRLAVGNVPLDGEMVIH